MISPSLEGVETAIRASQDKMVSNQKAVKSYQQKTKIPLYNLHENIWDAQEEVKAIINVIQEKMEENQGKMEAAKRSGQEEMKAAINSIRPELEYTIKSGVEVVVASVNE
jgi:hypothetical protein